LRTFTDFIQLNNDSDPELYPEVIEETALRTMSAIALTARVRQLQNQITNIKIRSNEPQLSLMNKLFLKLDLISNQNFINSILISQTLIMEKQ
jgi:hypothetical protein